MYFQKFPYVRNFEFSKKLTPNSSLKTARGTFNFQVRATPEDSYHFKITGPLWEQNESTAGLRTAPFRAAAVTSQNRLLSKLASVDEVPGADGAQRRSVHEVLDRASTGATQQFATEVEFGKKSNTKLLFDKKGGLQFLDHSGKVLIESASESFFGQCGKASLFQFLRKPEDRFYGLGEKWNGFEHSNKTTKFWNTDVWGDFHGSSFVDGAPAVDPTYVSIPYLIIHRGTHWIGLFLDNPHATFISTGFKASIANQMELESSENKPSKPSSEKTILLGSEEGQPNLYLFVATSLAQLTERFQKFLGTTPRPPAWALGYHQCRWGYRSEHDLLDLDRNFTKHQIPVDGLWLDIDYMRGYRVFTFDKKHFPNPKKAFASLRKKGRRVVPIIDPGVKAEAGYSIYEEGHAKRAFCLNPQGKEYIGLVWPGDTVFPDFSLKSTRAWWANEVASLGKLGIEGAWLDMNEPATGPADCSDMLFAQGTKSHSTFHNQYARAMAEASREGFLKAHPRQRPFLLCRGGSPGSNRSTALWTGDNYSNYYHLANSIPTTLNLALSGIPFNAPDMGGFGGDATEQLITDWFKLGFLFPFFRNHANAHTRTQEPWAFGARTCNVLRYFIRLRYRLRPYLYQLFLAQEKNGEAILRPLFYDFEETKNLPLGLIDDQFLVGSHILQAPFVKENQREREVVLPGTEAWYEPMEGCWHAGNQKITTAAAPMTTPFYIRDGAVLPLARLQPEEHRFDGLRVDFRIILSEGKKTSLTYIADDGISFEYSSGKESSLELTFHRNGTTLEIHQEETSSRAGKIDPTFTTETSIHQVLINGRPAKRLPAQGVALGKEKTKTWE